MTYFGVIWIILCLVSLLLPLRYFFGLLIFSCVFQSTGVFVFGGGKTLFPILVTEAFFFLRIIPIVINKKTFIVTPLYKRLLLFIIFAIFSALILPFLFKNNVRVYSSSKGIDSNFIVGGYLLKPSFSNLNQVIYLVIHLLICLLIIQIKHLKINQTKFIEFVQKIVFFSIAFVVIIGFWEYLSKITGIFFPKSFFVTDSRALSGTTQTGLIRLSSTFLEPSFAGGFLAASFWGVWAQKSKKMKLFASFILIALILNLSGTGIVAFGFGLFLFIIRNNFKQFLILLAIAGLFFIVLSNYFGELVIFILSKSDSGSGVHRFGAMLFSIELFFKTYGVGVGLGSHRGSSFLFTLMASLGLIGTILFAEFIRKGIYICLANKLNNNYNFIFYFSTVLLFAQVIAIPDLSYTPFWMWIFLLFLIEEDNKRNFKNKKIAL